MSDLSVVQNPVTAGPSGSGGALITATTAGGAFQTLQETLNAMLVEMRVISFLLNRINSDQDDLYAVRADETNNLAQLLIQQ